MNNQRKGKNMQLLGTVHRFMHIVDTTRCRMQVEIKKSANLWLEPNTTSYKNWWERINFGLVFQHPTKPDSSVHCFAVSFLEPCMTRMPKFRTSKKTFPC